MCKRRWERQRALSVDEHGSGRSRLGGVPRRITRLQGLRKNPPHQVSKSKTEWPQTPCRFLCQLTCFKHCRTSPWIHSRQCQLYNWLLGKFWKHEIIRGKINILLQIQRRLPLYRTKVTLLWSKCWIWNWAISNPRANVRFAIKSIYRYHMVSLFWKIFIYLCGCTRSYYDIQDL